LKSSRKKELEAADCGDFSSPTRGQLAAAKIHRPLACISAAAAVLVDCTAALFRPESLRSALLVPLTNPRRTNAADADPNGQRADAADVLSRVPRRTPESARGTSLRGCLQHVVALSKMAGKSSVVLAAAGAVAAGYGLYMLMRWRKYRVLFSPVFTEHGVPIKKKIYKVRFGKVEGENRGENPMDPPIIKDDDLYWLRDDKRKDHAVIAHLNRENAYFEHKFKPLRGMQAAIYKEFVSHTKETDEEVPYAHGPYVYYARSVKGLSYPIHCRKSRKAGTNEPMGEEQIVLDHNILGKGKSHCDVQQVETSPDHTLLAFTVDLTGYETYDIIVRDLATGIEKEKVEGCAGQVVWGKTNAEFFYTTMDEEHRPHKVWRHKLGQPQTQDECLLVEDDELFWLDIDKTCSGRFLVMDSGSPTRSEVRLLDIETPGATIQQVQARSEDHRYSVEHWGDNLYIITNTDGCINSKLMQTPVKAMGKR